MRKHLGVLLLTLSLFVLAGCGQKKPTETIDSFSFSLPQGYQEVPVTLFENNNTHLQVRKAYKRDDQTYKSNVVVGSSDQTFDNFDSFFAANIQKIKNTYANFEQKQTGSKKISCGKDSYEFKNIDYTVTQAANLDNQGKKVHFWQGYLNRGGKVYIFTISSLSETEKNSLKKSVLNIKCS